MWKYMEWAGVSFCTLVVLSSVAIWLGKIEVEGAWLLVLFALIIGLSVATFDGVLRLLDALIKWMAK